MGEAILWLAVLTLIAMMIWALVRDNGRKSRRSVEEYERDVIEGQASMMRGGMLELDKFAGGERQKRAAIEYRMDEESGRTKTGSKGDDRDRTGVENDG